MLSMFFLLYIPIGIIGGLLMACLGFGAGLIAVPTLFFGLRYLDLPAQTTMHIAVATSLMVMLCNGINATVLHNQHKSIRWDLVKILLPYIAMGSLLGSVIGSRIDGDALRYFFIAYIAYIIYQTLMQKPHPVNTTSNFKLQHSRQTFIIGNTIGLLSTLLGIGGSVFTIPFFRRKKLSMHQCIAMAAVLTLPVSIIGTIGYIWGGWNQPNLPQYSWGYVYWPAALCLVAGGAIGIQIGARMVYRLPEHYLSRAYLIVLAIVLAMMSVK
jgi:uncharacterized protein